MRSTCRSAFVEGRCAAAALILVLLAACDTGALGPTGAADPADGLLLAVGGGAQGPQAACFTCHGLNGEGDGLASPRLAGLQAGYLEKQLHDYVRGLRPDSVMTPISRGMSVEERRAVARYYAALPPVGVREDDAPSTALAMGAALYMRGAPERGLVPCADCHGPPAEGGGLANPALAGQPALYTRTQLERWRRGERRNDPLNQMVAVAQILTLEEIAALADFLAAVSPSIEPTTEAPPQAPSGATPRPR